ncbi:MAG: hypothetical protein ACRDS9_22225, partial [Pseudonocardiaceae bacterium]
SIIGGRGVAAHLPQARSGRAELSAQMSQGIQAHLGHLGISGLKHTPDFITRPDPTRDTGPQLLQRCLKILLPAKYRR